MHCSYCFPQRTANDCSSIVMHGFLCKAADWPKTCRRLTINPLSVSCSFPATRVDHDVTAGNNAKDAPLLHRSQLSKQALQ